MRIISTPFNAKEFTDYWIDEYRSHNTTFILWFFTSDCEPGMKQYIFAQTRRPRLPAWVLSMNFVTGVREGWFEQEDCFTTGPTTGFVALIMVSCLPQRMGTRIEMQLLGREKGRRAETDSLFSINLWKCAQLCNFVCFQSGLIA